MASRIHPTAVVHNTVQIGEDVEIGPMAVVEANVAIGDGCRLMASSVIRRNTRLGDGNVVHPFAVLGGEPQDFKFDANSLSYLVIGNNNVFREGVTVSRATGEGNATVVGDDNYFMTVSHAGHNSVVGNRCILVNNAVVGGHAELGDGATLSANAAVHQYCWVGEMSMSQGQSVISQHVPPYCMLGGSNLLHGLNRVGLRRAAHISAEDRRQIAEAYAITYRTGLTMTKALERMEACKDWGEAADKFRRFIRQALEAQPPYRRGLCGAAHRRREKAAIEPA